jgi:hypothetical protein
LATSEKKKFWDELVVPTILHMLHLISWKYQELPLFLPLNNNGDDNDDNSNVYDDDNNKSFGQPSNKYF